jgi:hypothetical protein
MFHSGIKRSITSLPKYLALLEQNWGKKKKPFETESSKPFLSGGNVFPQKLGHV